MEAHRKPVLLWESANIRCSAGTSWLSIIRDDGPALRLRRTDDMTKAAGLLFDCLDKQAKAVTGTVIADLEAGLLVAQCRCSGHIELAWDGQTFVLAERLVYELQRWLAHISGAVAAPALVGDIARVSAGSAAGGRTLELMIKADERRSTPVTIGVSEPERLAGYLFGAAAMSAGTTPPPLRLPGEGVLRLYPINAGALSAIIDDRPTRIRMPALGRTSLVRIAMAICEEAP